MSRWPQKKTILYDQGRAALHAALDLVIPSTCAFCRSDLGDPNGWLGLCQNCCNLFTRSANQYCARCGDQYDALQRKMPIEQNGWCESCKQTSFMFSNVFTIGPYQSQMRAAVLQTKQPHGYPLAVALGRLLAQTQKKFIDAFHPDMVIAIPMHWWRRILRGTDGPDAIAAGMAKYLGLPKVNRAIIRSRNTKKQVALPRTQRIRNLKNAFRLHKKRVLGKRILLVDDVMTTGTTCNEVARVFREHGACDVAVAVVARQGLNTPKTTVYP